MAVTTVAVVSVSPSPASLSFTGQDRAHPGEQSLALDPHYSHVNETKETLVAKCSAHPSAQI